MSRPPHILPASIPDVPEGTVLQLTGHDWSHCASYPPGAYVDITVSRVHRGCFREQNGVLWVWVVGHRHPSCRWPHVEQHVPCLQLMVRVDMLTRASIRPGSFSG